MNGDLSGVAGAGRPPAVQLGLLWGAAAVSAAALAVSLHGSAARALALLLPCPFRTVTGLPCPACGSGRASAALAAFDLPSAFTSNPLFTLGALVFLVGGLLAAAFALAGRGVPEPRTLPVVARAAVVAGVGANWLWLLLDGR
ncbi:MAG: DUF2752 domain-containing protein [Thermoanaerobaculia bacterium]